MIRRNVASQWLYFPQLVLAADGTAVTSGATLTVAKDGTGSASAGTLAHVANGVWRYQLTQGETDCAMIGSILTATNAIPVVLNVVTTAADTSAVALGAATPANVTTSQGFITALLPAALVSGRIDASVGSMSANTLAAAALATDALAEISQYLAAEWLNQSGLWEYAFIELATSLDLHIDSFSELKTDHDTILAAIAAMVAKLNKIKLNPIGPPFEAGVLKLVKGKAYLAANGNTITIPIPTVAGWATADQVLLSAKNKKTRVTFLNRIVATSVDVENATATFEIPAATLNYDADIYHEFGIELKHGTAYQEILTGPHILRPNVGG